MIAQLLSHPLLYKFSQAILISQKKRSDYIINFVNAKPADRVLDIGCGPGIALEFLPKVSYLGFDLNYDYIEYAKKKYGNLGVEFYCQKVGSDVKLEPSTFDLVMANGILHHLTDDESISLLKLAYEALKPGGRLITFDGCYSDGQHWFAKYMLSKDRGEYVRNSQSYEKLVSNVFPVYKSTVRSDLLRIPYTHIIFECEK